MAKAKQLELFAAPSVAPIEPAQIEFLLIQEIKANPGITTDELSLALGLSPADIVPVLRGRLLKKGKKIKDLGWVLADHDLGCKVEENCTLITDPPDLGCKVEENCTLITDPPDLGCKVEENCTLITEPVDLGCKPEDNRTLSLEKIIQHADGLSDRDFQQLLDALNGLKELKAAPVGVEPETETEAESKPIGYLELKKINGYGPYRYLRYRSGGRYRSVYLGKPIEPN